MRLTDHCKICDNSTFNFKKGLLCSLTGDKPSFYNTCNTFKSGDKLEQVIIEINEDYELSKNKKSISYMNFLFFTVVGICMIVGSVLYGQFLSEKGYVSVLPLGLSTTGLLITTLAMGPLNKYRREIAVSKKNMSDLDYVLNLYGITYKFNTTITKDVHGNESCKSHLELSLPPNLKYQP